MRKTGKKNIGVGGCRGFTLMELIASMLLLSIISAVWGMGLIQAVNGYLLFSQNEESVQNVQLAMSRLTREFQAMKAFEIAPSPGRDAVTYARESSDGTDIIIPIVYDSGNLYFDGDSATGSLLCGNLQTFRFSYYENHDSPEPPAVDPTGGYSPDVKSIGIHIEINGAGSSVLTFDKRVFLIALVEK